MSKTKLVIGIDEAGYGPSMGPLVICGTAWQVPDRFDAQAMSQLLEPEFLAKPLRANSKHIPIGDSKKIHREALAFQGLQLGVHFLTHELVQNQPKSKSASQTTAHCPISLFAPVDSARLNNIPWYASEPSTSAPSYLAPENETYELFKSASAKLNSLSIQLVGIQMRVLDEIEFNRQIDLTQNKSSTLSETSLNLIKDMLLRNSLPGQSTEVFCDKHGGRNRYQSLLSYCFDQQWFSIEREGKECSRYLGNWNNGDIAIQFQVEGDSLFPSAAASIVAKWTRESLMDRLNRFWKSKCDGNGSQLKPTAGYYVDAMRFAGEIEATAEKLRLAKETWWRKK